ncbi:glycosyl transferase [Oceanobacillus bengalensis]|uniref:Glycosyl transferase n=1 Tax=Oceanobacillus bengalensis TaxID=1435466 RepID=A0A494YYV0_9BACI|nr:glycosyl transferase [Oceanobacillus bengalensis]
MRNLLKNDKKNTRHDLKVIYINTFCRNQKEVSSVINAVIDQYWEKLINEQEMIKMIETIVANNESLVLKEKSFTTTVKQVCGKRRLEIVARIIDL